MKKGLIAVSLLILMVATTTQAQGGVTFGVGVSGGLTYPIVQDDQGNGTVFALRGRWSLGGFGVLEPTLAFTKYGAPDPFEIDGHSSLDLGIDGSKLTMYGLNFVLGGAPGTVGLKPIFMGGVGFYEMSNDDTENLQESETKLGFSGGIGLVFALSSQFELDGRGQLHVIPSEGGASKKSVTLLVGININLGGN